MKSKSIKAMISGVLLCTTFLYTTPVLAYTKDETVYSKLNNNGVNYNTIVSTHIKNTENEELLKDLSDLINIENTNGDETYTKEENAIIWNAKKHDIYYKGESKKELPIECKVEYELNGNKISANDIIGKDGKIKVIINYTNKDEHIININGKAEKLYTPFVVVAGTIINNENNKNIEITNGKVIDDGDKTIALGMAFPGLQESLNISKSNLELPSSIEISMDATDFQMNSIINLVTPKVIETDDIEAFNKLDEIYSKIETLQTSSQEIEEGANTLKEGTTVYSEKSKEFESAMGKMSQGVSSASNSYKQIDNGVQTLNESSIELENGARAISEGIGLVENNIYAISKSLETAETGSVDLVNGIETLETGVDSIISSVSKIEVPDNSEIIQSLNELISANTNMISSLSSTNNVLEAKYEEEASEEILEQIKANKTVIGILQLNNKAQKETLSTLQSTDTSSILALQGGLMQVKEGINNLEDGVNSLSEGISAIKVGAETLAKKTGDLTAGSNSLYEGTTQLSEGTEDLMYGSKQMRNGLSELDRSSNLLLEANNSLTDGAETIEEGAISLAEGISKFNEEGISKICDYINNDVKNVTVRVEKLTELAKEYNNFTMIDDGQEGSLKFVMIIDELNKNQKDNNEIILNSEQNVTIKEENE